MRIISGLAVLLWCVSGAFAAVKTQVIEYKQGDTALEGYLAYDDATDAKRPGVLVVPEWWGNNDYSRKRAEQLAQLGYVGFAIDMYGKGKTTDDPKQAGEWAGEVKKDLQLEKARIEAAIDTVKQQPMVDPNRLGAIGYCFGGAIVLDMARLGEPVLGVVSFHGDLTSKIPAQNIKAKILVCTGAADKFVPPEQVKSFEEEMKKAGADFKVVSYPGAHHSFTNPNADQHHMDNIQYNAEADRQSWDAMKSFFVDLFKQG